MELSAGHVTDGWLLPVCRGQTPLYVASARDQPHLVARLIDAGAKVGAPSKDGVTALMGASGQGRGGIVGQLLSAGAEVDATDKAGRTALMGACPEGPSNVVKQPLGTDTRMQHIQLRPRKVQSLGRVPRAGRVLCDPPRSSLLVQSGETGVEFRLTAGSLGRQS
ncbi:Ankyrin repeat [Diplonema papillatum]|nr:Ankyrin repeat [Diplonema papillatum]